ncbi:IS701 family transposase [Streptomyces sviceus]|uniref:IS701 family transposase n=1 Tax=Streptomyces sviceus TaxID=285530 RepID=UPI00382E6E94
MVRAFSTVAPGPAATAATIAAGSVPRARTGSPDHPAFDAFVAEIFERLPRADQRRWAHVYTRGLLMTPGRKTVRRLAASVSDSATAAQALHQFVNASPWDWEPVRARLADWVVRRSGPRALLLATAVLPKRGDRSCGVHRRFVPQEGRTVNCQVGIGAFLAADRATVPVDWRLLLPGPWSADPQVRDRARVPEDAAGTQDSGAAQALDLVDGIDLSRADPDGVPVVADLVGFADTAALAVGLAARGRRFVVAVPGDLVVLADRAGSGVPGVSGVSGASGVFGPSGGWAGASGVPGAVSAGAGAGVLPTRTDTSGLTTRAGASGLPTRAGVGAVPGRPGGAGVTVRGLLAAHDARLPGRLPGAPVVPVRLPGVPVPLRLTVERRPSEAGGDRFWLTDLVDRPARETPALARLHTGAADTMERLADDFGLRAFEGRSYPGWHHHMTLVSAAFAYGALGRAGAPPTHPARASRGPQPGRPPRRARTLTTPTRTGCS